MLARKQSQREKTQAAVRRLVIKVEPLAELQIKPQLRVNIDGAQREVRFHLDPQNDPKAPVKYLDPRPGTVEIQLVRPGGEVVSAVLGTPLEGNGKWQGVRRVDLQGYVPGEEKEWSVKVVIRHEDTN
jgi:hypothetical protein